MSSFRFEKIIPRGFQKILNALSWIEVTDKPTTFTPTAHTHTVADIAGLAGALVFKGSLGANFDSSQMLLIQGYMYKVVTSVSGSTITDLATGDSFKDTEEIFWDGTHFVSLGADLDIPIISVNSETELLVSVDKINNYFKGGILILGSDIQMTQNWLKDFSKVEIWGESKQIKMYNAGNLAWYYIHFQKSQSIFKDILFVGESGNTIQRMCFKSNYSPTGTVTPAIGLSSVHKFIGCSFTHLTGATNIGTVGTFDVTACPQSMGIVLINCGCGFLSGGTGYITIIRSPSAQALNVRAWQWSTFQTSYSSNKIGIIGASNVSDSYATDLSVYFDTTLVDMTKFAPLVSIPTQVQAEAAATASTSTLYDNFLASLRSVRWLLDQYWNTNNQVNQQTTATLSNGSTFNIAAQKYILRILGEKKNAVVGGLLSIQRSDLSYVCQNIAIPTANNTLFNVPPSYVDADFSASSSRTYTAIITGGATLTLRIQLIKS